MENFPIPAPGFNGASRRTEVDNVLNWFRQGWAICSSSIPAPG
jgi:hypothetical protein